MEDAIEAGVARLARVARLLGVAAMLAAWAGPAAAQLVLPGAVEPTGQGASVPAAAPGRGPVKARSVAPPAPAAVPSPLSLAGKTLSLNGGRSQISFAAGPDKQLSVSRLTLVGRTAGQARTDCTVQAAPGPLATSGIGRPAGLDRLQVALPACPLTFDVLDGAILAVPLDRPCTFSAADACEVVPAGLWGPGPGDFSPARIKDIERARARAEAAVRANYKALTASTKDRPTVMGYARDQAQFSSTREETCRDYAAEGNHGFCSTKLTEARAADLRAKLDVALQAKAARKVRRRPGQAAN